jgi:hypothetical protein
MCICICICKYIYISRLIYIYIYIYIIYIYIYGNNSKLVLEETQVVARGTLGSHFFRCKKKYFV